MSLGLLLPSLITHSMAFYIIFIRISYIIPVIKNYNFHVREIEKKYVNSCILQSESTETTRQYTTRK